MPPSRGCDQSERVGVDGIQHDFDTAWVGARRHEHVTYLARHRDDLREPGHEPAIGRIVDVPLLRRVPRPPVRRRRGMNGVERASHHARASVLYSCAWTMSMRRSSTRARSFASSDRSSEWRSRSST